ncbi:MAG TPA: hypothetical protein VF011_03115 [Terriglobales bacterium]
MPLDALLSKEQLDALRRCDTCMVSNAIETFEVRLRNTGFAAPGVRCIFEYASSASRAISPWKS